MSNRSGRTDAELRIDRELKDFQDRAIKMWKGHEKAGTIALVRALDMTATAHVFSSSLQGEPATFKLMGATSALRPFLSAIRGQAGGVPWRAPTDDAFQFAYSYLNCCGQLTHLRRMAALERYGLARTSLTQDGGLLIETSHGGPEMTAREAMDDWKLAENLQSPSDESIWNLPSRLRQRMKFYVDSDPQTFIRYDNDQEIVSTFQLRAKRYGSYFLEGEAFPDDVPLGDRTFGEWKTACDQAVGRILCHIEFCEILKSKRSNTRLDSIMTIFSRRDDIAAIWQEAGLGSERIQSTMKALTLEFDGLDDYENAYEIPCSFYIDLGRDFVLLPCFGALTNPYFALFRHLRQTYKSDWDRGVDRREEIFRSDLRSTFNEPRYYVPDNGFQLRRSDGSMLTDIDAVILDRLTGRLALVQLKWHDIFGRSLAERESRKKNIRKANEWVDRIDSWLTGRTSRAAARELGLHADASELPPVLFVVARYLARFSGEDDQDSRASWMGWPEIKQGVRLCKGNDTLAELSQLISKLQMESKDAPEVRTKFNFSKLSVELRVGPAAYSSGQ